jgi:hypothetical protein
MPVPRVGFRWDGQGLVAEGMPDPESLGLLLDHPGHCATLGIPADPLPEGFALSELHELDTSGARTIPPSAPLPDAQGRQLADWLSRFGIPPPTLASPRAVLVGLSDLQDVATALVRWITGGVPPVATWGLIRAADDISEAVSQLVRSAFTDGGWSLWCQKLNAQLRCQIGFRADGAEGCTTDLLTAIACQLHNITLDLIDGLPLRQCANESCERYFLRQRGTAKQGQYRSKGVLYCSGRCANTQAQRARRRRDRERKQKGASDAS